MTSKSSLAFDLASLRKRQIALPQDHGAWVFLLMPLLVGLFLGENISTATVLVILAALAVFLLRQPITMGVKVMSGRRPKRDLPAIYFWTAVYGLIALISAVGLVREGYEYLLLLGLPGIPVFAWYLFLISRRAERRQIGVEVVAGGVLALAGPAALWVGIGEPVSLGWWLWFLMWLQSAASIVYAYLRLQQRGLPTTPSMRGRFSLASRALAYSTFNLGLAMGLSISGRFPILLFVPYGLQFLETIWGTLNPAIGIRPTLIGLRQLAVSTAFTILFILVWSFSP